MADKRTKKLLDIISAPSTPPSKLLKTIEALEQAQNFSALGAKDGFGNSALHLLAARRVREGEGDAALLEILERLLAVKAAPPLVSSLKTWQVFDRVAGRWRPVADQENVQVEGMRGTGVDSFSVAANTTANALVRTEDIWWDLSAMTRRRMEVGGTPQPVRHPDFFPSFERSVHLHPGGRKLGVTFSAAPSPSDFPSVASVLEGEYVCSSKLCPGDLLLELNGLSLQGFSIEELRAAWGGGGGLGAWGDRPVILKVSNGDPQRAQNLFFLDACNSYGQTPLSIAIRCGCFQAAAALLRLGARPDCEVPVRLVGSMRTGSGAVREVAGGEYENGPGLVPAGEIYDVQVLKPSSVGLRFLISPPSLFPPLSPSSAASPSSPSKSRWVVESAHGISAEACVSRGDALLAVNGIDCEALGGVELTALLRTRPLWLTFKKGDGVFRTPLMLASSTGNYKICEMLLGVNALSLAGAVDLHGLTCIDLAMQEKRFSVLSLFRRYGLLPEIYAKGGTLKVLLPPYWRSVRLSGESEGVPFDLSAFEGGQRFKAMQEAPLLVPLFQKMFDLSFERKWTRDRLLDGQKVPDSLEVERVQINVNASNFKEFVQRQAEIGEEMAADQVNCPLNLKNYLPPSEWEAALGEAGGGGVFPPNGFVNECFLFHGTRPDAALAIASKDFRLAFAGSAAGSLYGPGLYFAESCAKSDEYSVAGEGGERAMLVCRVTLGSLLHCSEEVPEVDSILTGVNRGAFHSVLGDREKVRGTFREFIVFDDDQVYPEFVVWYRRKYAEESQEVDVPSFRLVTREEEVLARPLESGVKEIGEGLVEGQGLEGGRLDRISRVGGGPVHVVHFDGRIHTERINFGLVSTAELLQRAGRRWQDMDVMTPGEMRVLVVEPPPPPEREEGEVLKRLRPPKEAPLPLLSVPVSQLRASAHSIFLLLRHDYPIKHTAQQARSVRLQKVLDFYKFYLDLSGSGLISKGELRVALWNLSLSPAQFERVFSAFDASKTGYVDKDELMFLLGSEALRRPSIPLDQLLSDAALTLLEGDATDGLDLKSIFEGKERAFEVEAAGKVESFEKLKEGHHRVRFASAFCTSQHLCHSILQLIAFSSFLYILIYCVEGGGPFLALLVFLFLCLYCCYLCVSFRARGISTALDNKLFGMDAVLEETESCMAKDPRYYWRICCYHYKTVRRKGKTKRVRVNTHRASAEGALPSSDHTDPLIPNTRNLFTHIQVEEDIDYSGTDYMAKFQSWVERNDRDRHKDVTRTEKIPGAEDILACWVPDHPSPWWTSSSYDKCFGVFCLSSCFRSYVKSQCSEQLLVYRKRCFDIGAPSVEESEEERDLGDEDSEGSSSSDESGSESSDLGGGGGGGGRGERRGSAGSGYSGGSGGS